MADGAPKDYSSVYCEDLPPIPTHHLDLKPPPLPIPPIVSSRGSQQNGKISSIKNRVHHDQNHNINIKVKSLDGSHATPYHREQSVDLMKVVAKLNQLPKDNHHAYAMDTLNKHFSTVFTNRRRFNDQKEQQKIGFRVYIQYSGEKDTFVVRAEQNTLKAIRDKMPKRGNYRYFFRSRDSTCEELEFDESTVPYHEKDGQKQIYCQVFPY